MTDNIVYLKIIEEFEKRTNKRIKFFFDNKTFRDKQLIKDMLQICNEELKEILKK